MCDGIIMACVETLEAKQLIVVSYDKPPSAGPRACVAHQLQHDVTRVRSRRFLVRKLRALVVKKRSFAVLEAEVITRHGSPDLLHRLQRMDHISALAARGADRRE